MTPIELEAALLLQGSPARKGFPIAYDISRAHAIEALCRALERHEAFKQEVSEALRPICEALHKSPDGNINWRAERLGRFILPKPADPLVEAMQDAAIGAAAAMGLKLTGYNVEQEAADRLRKALAARGLEIVEADNAA